MPLSVKILFERIGELFIRELESNIRNQIDIRGKKYSPVLPSTIKARQRLVGGSLKRMKGEPTGPSVRLFFTGRFSREAFKYLADEDSVTIYISDAIYSGSHSQHPVTYADIVRRNNEGNNELNPNIKSPPLIFPNNENEVVLMKSWNTAFRLIEHAVQDGEIEEMLFSD